MYNELLKKLEKMKAENFLFFVDMLKYEINDCKKQGVLVHKLCNGNFSRLLIDALNSRRCSKVVFLIGILQDETLKP